MPRFFWGNSLTEYTVVVFHPAPKLYPITLQVVSLMKSLIGKNVFLKSLVLVGLAAAIPAVAGDAAAGKVLTTACAACHGADGNSMAPNFPKLAGQSEKYLVKQMLDIKDGQLRAVPEMAGQMDSLGKADIENIAAYYSSKTMSLSGAKNDAELLALGEKIYRAGNKEAGVPACIGCHSPTGAGNAPAGFPLLGGQHADYVAKQLKDFRTGAEYADKGRRNDGDIRIMRDGVARMSEREIEAVSNYISGLH
jgi:cytochrome c553